MSHRLRNLGIASFFQPFILKSTGAAAAERTGDATGDKVLCVRCGDDVERCDANPTGTNTTGSYKCKDCNRNESRLRRNFDKATLNLTPEEHLCMQYISVAFFHRYIINMCSFCLSFSSYHAEAVSHHWNPF